MIFSAFHPFHRSCRTHVAAISSILAASGIFDPWDIFTPDACFAPVVVAFAYQLASSGSSSCLEAPFMPKVHRFIFLHRLMSFVAKRCICPWGMALTGVAWIATTAWALEHLCTASGSTWLMSYSSFELSSHHSLSTWAPLHSFRFDMVDVL